MGDRPPKPAEAAPRGLRIGLAVKLAACLVVTAASFFALFGALQLRLQRRHSEELILLSAERISDLIHSGTRYSMLHNDRDAVHHSIRNMGAEPGVRRVRLYNEEGRIQYSSDDAEIGRMVDKTAEACYACHAQHVPLQKLDRPDRARIFSDPSGRRTLAVIRPIENRPECANAACHAHPSSRRILGVIDAQLSLENVDSQLAENQRQIRLSTLVALVLLCLLSVAFTWLVVHRPIKELTRGIQEVAKGDLEHRLPVRSNDELGDLASSFNSMAGELDQAHQELTGWARTLEDRVHEKTTELEKAHRILVSSEKMASLGKLAATVAHEVNNPLFAMLTYARLSLKDLDKLESQDPARKAGIADNLKLIERESRRCGDLMKNLLAFARQSKPQRAPNDLNLIVERAIKLVQHQMALQEIRLRTELPPLPEIQCDAAKIQQALLAVLVNAAEVMPKGGSVTVRTGFDAANKSALIRIRDTGPGIAPDVLPNIFEPFFTTKENTHRTGLGLAIVKGIIEQHSGTIAVETTLGQGTEFIISLPAEAPAAAAEPAAAGAAANRTG
ncbi:MAG: ATP-binding protein [Bryobacteraceae bacterium]|nr:ATP-binding protein [Bryobacteraceae bacterium]